MTTDSISVSWHIVDVSEVRPDLTDEQCRTVLANVLDQYDANEGICWSMLENIALSLYGSAPND